MAEEEQSGRYLLLDRNDFLIDEAGQNERMEIGLWNWGQTTANARQLRSYTNNTPFF